MPISDQILGLESSDTRMAEAYRSLKNLWDAGDRDREVGLHLMFLAWYGVIEPSHLTGFTKAPEEQAELRQVLSEVHAYFETNIPDDAEMLYAFGLVGHMFWYMFDDDPAWEERAVRYRKRYRELAPNGIDPAIFEGRGAYGNYYAMQARVKDGF